MSIDLLDAILCVDPNDKTALLARGSVYSKLGNAKSASSDFSRVLKIDPNQSKGYYLRGFSKETKDDDYRALKDFYYDIDIDPEYKAAYRSRATLLTKMGQETEAAEDMKIVAQVSKYLILNA